MQTTGDDWKTILRYYSELSTTDLVREFIGEDLAGGVLILIDKMFLVLPFKNLISKTDPPPKKYNCQGKYDF